MHSTSFPCRTATPSIRGGSLTVAASEALATDPIEIMARWFASLGHSARATYRRALRQFSYWATGSETAPDAVLRLLCDAGRVGARQLALGWRAHLEQNDKASGTIASMLSGLSGCVTAARLAGLVDWQLERIAPRIEQREDRSGPPRHEIERLCAHLDELCTDTAHRRWQWAVRDTAIIRLLHGAALRRNEVAGLRIADVHLGAEGGPTVNALRKGKRERETMLVGPLAARSLRLWLDHRGTDDPTAPVFVRLHGRQTTGNEKPLRGEAIRELVAKRAKDAGLRGPCRPHGLRHSAASHVARNGSLAALKRLGGWTTLTSPSRYLDRDDRDRQAALNIAEV